MGAHGGGPWPNFVVVREDFLEEEALWVRLEDEMGLVQARKCGQERLSLRAQGHEGLEMRACGTLACLRNRVSGRGGGGRQRCCG